MVGSGALGCELLKNFAMMGVGCGTGSVTLTDDDVIEVSNLSRQFLFRNSDVGSPKSVSAGRAVSVMNPEFTGHVRAMENRVSPKTEDVFNGQFWAGLDVVVNALDNIPARLYVDSKCVEHQKPLLESGTTGTKCNVQVVLPFMTAHYGATRDPPEKETPICLLHTFPYNIEHTLIWAKSEFTGEFETKPGEVISYLTNEDYIDNLRTEGSVLTKLKALEKFVLTEQPSDFADCVGYARRLFDGEASEHGFTNRIKQLIHSYPEDAMIKDPTSKVESRFWAPPKRFPKVLEFDPDDETHMQFVIAAANLRANVFAIPKPDGFRDDIAMYKQMLQKAEATVVPFSPTDDVKIDIGEPAAEEQDDAEVTDDEAAIAELIERLGRPGTGLIGGKSVKMVPEEFEKDHDDNFHMDFITSASNLRARNYGIAEVDKLKAKLIAGKIIPALATTTAVATGLVCLELYKVLQEEAMQDLENFKDGYLNLALPPDAYMVFTEPGMPEVTRFGESSWTIWDRWMFSYECTLQGMLDWLKGKGLQVTSVFCDSAPVYMGSLHKKRLPQKLQNIMFNAPIGRDVTDVNRRVRLAVKCSDPQSVTLQDISSGRSRSALCASINALVEPKCGLPTRIDITSDERETSARVVFASPDFAASAVRLDGANLDGDIVRISYTELDIPPLLLCSDAELAIEEQRKAEQRQLEKQLIESKLEKVASAGGNSDAGGILSRQGSRLSRAYTDTESDAMSIDGLVGYKDGDSILCKRWWELSEDEIKAAEFLGYIPELDVSGSEDEEDDDGDEVLRWPSHAKDGEWTVWDDLTEDERNAAIVLGFSEETWPPNDDPEDEPSLVPSPAEWEGEGGWALERTMSQCELDMIDMERKWKRELSTRDLFATIPKETQELLKEARKIFELPGNVNDQAHMLMQELKSLVFSFMTKQQEHTQVEAIDNDIFKWSVKFHGRGFEGRLREQLANCAEEYGAACGCVTLEFEFPLGLYPYFPPTVKLVRPRCRGWLLGAIMGDPVFSQRGWHPLVPMSDVLQHLHSILQRHADVDVQSLLNVMPHAYSELELSLIKLESLTNTAPAAAVHYKQLYDDIAANAKPFLEIKSKFFTTQKKKKGSSGGGSGFRYGELDMSVYDKMAESTSANFKDTQMVIELKRLVQVLQESDIDAEQQQFFRDSCLLPLLKAQLGSTGFSGLSERREFFRYIVDVAASCFRFEWLRPSLPFVLEGLQSVARSAAQFLKVAKATKQGDDKLIDLATNIVEIAKTAEGAWELLKQLPVDAEPAPEDVSDTVDEPSAETGPETDWERDRRENQEYCAALHDEQFALETGIRDKYMSSSSMYKNEAKGKEDGGDTAPRQAKLMSELTGLSDRDLPLSLSSTAFLRADESHMYSMQFAITGPEGTPYEGGFFIFNCFCKNDYPTSSPKVDIVTNGGGDTRCGHGPGGFNPNLYPEGKVCLSLLGTWGTNNWSKHSSILQIIVSIQGMILVPDPIFNEPGVEKNRGTKSGDSSDVTANKKIREGTIKHAMIDHMRNQKPFFGDAVLLHFKHRRAAILRCVDRWIEEAMSGKWNEGRTEGQPKDEEHAKRLRGLKEDLVKELDKIK